MDRKRMRTKMIFAGLLLCMAGILSGCAGSQSSTFSPAESRIFVSRAGEISSATVETYEEKEYYSAEGLKAYIDQSVAEYNQKAGTPDAVTLESCTMENGTASVTFRYKSGEDLVNFANEYEDTANQVTSIEVLSMPDAVAQGKLEEGAVVKTKDRSAVSADTVSKDQSLHVVVIEGTALVQTEGKILFAADDITLTDNFTAKVPEGKHTIIFK